MSIASKRFVFQWAEVLSADAFSAFEEVGLENEVVKSVDSSFKCLKPGKINNYCLLAIVKLFWIGVEKSTMAPVSV